MNRKPNRVKICSLQNMLVSEKKEKSEILTREDKIEVDRSVQ